jgi:hypothetical protein
MQRRSILRARNADDAAEEFIPFFRGTYCYFIDITMTGGFRLPMECTGGGACVTLRDAAAEGRIGRDAPA